MNTADAWRDALSAIEGIGHVTVLEETASTQDIQVAAHGDVVVALRQPAGRGRRGRVWHDPDGEGVAITLAMLSIDAVAAAVAVAEAAEHWVEHAGIAWPNDIVVHGRKLAGILIEQRGGLFLTGVGMNVLQRSWPPHLENRAISLAQVGVSVEPWVVGAQITRRLLAVPDRAEREVSAAWSRRDVLSGTLQQLQVGGEVVEGRIEAIDPRMGLQVRTDLGMRFLPLETTTIVHGS